MDNAKIIRGWLLYLGTAVIALTKIKRTILYDNNTKENVAEHSLHLALAAAEIAANYYPRLDTGLVAQFSIVHDLVEIYAGDVPTFDLAPDDRLAKEKAERVAHERLLAELPPHTAEMLRRYQAQKEPEARLVCLIDKLLPAAIHAVAAQVNREYFIKRFDIQSLDQVNARNKRFDAELRAKFPEFDVVLIAQRLLIRTARDKLWPHSRTEHGDKRAF